MMQPCPFIHTRDVNSIAAPLISAIDPLSCRLIACESYSDFYHSRRYWCTITVRNHAGRIQRRVSLSAEQLVCSSELRCAQLSTINQQPSTSNQQPLTINHQ